MSNQRVTIEPGSAFKYRICIDNRFYGGADSWWRAKRIYAKAVKVVQHEGWVKR